MTPDEAMAQAIALVEKVINMSKASEWTARWRATQAVWPASFKDRRRGTDTPGPYLTLAVTEAGECRLEKNGEWMMTLPVDVALAAARWIQDTFGETTP